MKINYISYFDPRLHRGGGEMIALDVVKTGIERGHTFTFSSVRPSKRIKYDDKADLDLVIDLFNYPGTFKSLGAWRDFPAALKDKVLQRKKFIHMSNAYVDICNLPYLPCSGSATPICLFKESIELPKKIVIKDFGSNCFATKKLVHSFFSLSKLNIFLSPLHRDTCLKVLNLQDATNNFVLRPTVDTKTFFNRNLKRDIEYLFVGVISEAKGFNEMRERFYDQDIHLAGNIYPGIKLDFGTYHGKISYDQVPALMNRAKNFVFLPRWPEPQGRVVIEAALSGCQLITNGRVGATSFDFDIGDPINLDHATDELWQAIEKIV